MPCSHVKEREGEKKLVARHTYYEGREKAIERMEKQGKSKRNPREKATERKEGRLVHATDKTSRVTAACRRSERGGKIPILVF